MSIEGGDGDPKLPPTGMINDFITGYMGALGAAAGLIKQTTEGGSWHVTVNLTRTAMWYQTLGLVDPNDTRCDDYHSQSEPAAYDSRNTTGRHPHARSPSHVQPHPTPLARPHPGAPRIQPPALDQRLFERQRRWRAAVSEGTGRLVARPRLVRGDY
jgi:hypothetical protein